MMAESFVDGFAEDPGSAAKVDTFLQISSGFNVVMKAFWGVFGLLKMSLTSPLLSVTAPETESRIPPRISFRLRGCVPHQHSLPILIVCEVPRCGTKDIHDSPLAGPGREYSPLISFRGRAMQEIRMRMKHRDTL